MRLATWDEMELDAAEHRVDHPCARMKAKPAAFTTVEPCSPSRIRLVGRKSHNPPEPISTGRRRGPTRALCWPSRDQRVALSELHLSGDYPRVRKGITLSLAEILDDRYDPQVVEELQVVWHW